MYLNHQEQFLHTAKFWTETYARPEASHDEVCGKREERGREGGREFRTVENLVGLPRTSGNPARSLTTWHPTRSRTPASLPLPCR